MKRDYEIQVVTRAFKVLEALAETDTELGVAEVADVLDSSRNSTFRLLYTLECGGYVEKNHDTKKYRLGIRLFELGNSVFKTTDLHRLAKPILEGLHSKFSETVNLAVMHDGQIVYIERLESPRSLRTSNTIGSRAYAHCTSLGKAMLAFLTPKKLEAILSKHGLPRVTPNTITDNAHLLNELQAIHQRGYAIDIEENVEGVCCVGAPIFDRWGTPTAALSISLPRHRFVDQDQQQIGVSVVAAATELSRRLGWPADISKKD